MILRGLTNISVSIVCLVFFFLCHISRLLDVLFYKLNNICIFILQKFFVSSKFFNLPWKVIILDQVRLAKWGFVLLNFFGLLLSWNRNGWL